MARRGENIYKRKDGRWEGRFIKKYTPEGKAKYGYVYAKTYRDVRERLASVRTVQSATTPLCNQALLGGYCEEWLTISRNRVKESTYVKYHNIVYRHLIPGLGRQLLRDLSTAKVEVFSNNLLRDGLSPKTVRDILVVLKSVLKYCRKQPNSGCPEIEIIYPRDVKNEMRVLSLEEQRQFIRYLTVKPDCVQFGVLLALLTGLRIGEICALKWGDISLSERLIRVSSTMQRLQNLGEAPAQKTKVIVGEAKSLSARRTIPMNDATWALCLRMQNLNSNAFVLTGEPNRFLEPRTLQYRLEKYTRDCNLKDVHFHTLRHTFATRCVEVGFEIKSLSEILGHASTKVTLDRYVHSSMELKRANMAKLDAVVM